MAADPLSGIVSSAEGMARELGKVTRVASRAGAELVRRELLASARVRNRSTMQGGKLGVTLKNYGATTTVGRAGKSAGAWAIYNDGTRAGYQIRPKRGRVLKLGDRFVTGPVRHPGNRATHVWDIGLRNAEPKVDDVVGDKLDEALRRGF